MSRRRRRRRSNGCLKCLTTFLIVCILIVGVVYAGGMFACKQYAEPTVGITFNEALGVIGTIYGGKESKAVTKPYAEEDLDSFYTDLRSSLYLKDTVDLKDSFSNVVADLLASKEETEAEVQTTAAGEGTPEEETQSSEPFTTGNAAIDDLLNQLDFDFSSLKNYVNEEETPQLLEISDKQLAAFLDDTISSLLTSDAINDKVGELTQSMGMSVDLTNVVKIPQVIIENKNPLDETQTGVTLTVALNLRQTVKSLLSSKSSALGIVAGIVPKAIYATITIFPNDSERSAQIVINAASDEKMSVILRLANAALKNTEYGSVDGILKTVNQKAIEAIAKVQELVPVSFVDSGSVELKPIKALMNMLKITEISETQFLSMIRDVCLPTFSDVSTSLGFPESITYDQISTIIDQKILLLIDELEDKYAIEENYLKKETLYSQLTKVDSDDGSDCLKNHIEPDRLPLADASYVASEHKVDVAYQAFAGIINGYLEENPISSGSMNMSINVINMYYSTSLNVMSIVLEINLLEALSGSIEEGTIVYKLVSQLIPTSLYMTANIELATEGSTTISVNGKSIEQTQEHLATMVQICTSLGMDAASLEYSSLANQVGDAVRNGLNTVGEKLGADLVFEEELVKLPNIYEVLAGIVFKDAAEALTPEEIYGLMHSLSYEMPQNFVEAASGLGLTPETTIEEYTTQVNGSMDTFVANLVNQYAIDNSVAQITNDNVYNKIITISEDKTLINSVGIENLPIAPDYSTYLKTDFKVETGYLALTNILNSYLQENTVAESGKLDPSKYSLINVSYDEMQKFLGLKIEVKLLDYINLDPTSSMYDIASQILHESIYLDVEVYIGTDPLLEQCNITIIGLDLTSSETLLERMIIFGKALGANMDALNLVSLKETLSGNVKNGLNNIVEKMGTGIAFSNESCQLPSIYEILANKILYKAEEIVNLTDEEVFNVFKGLKAIPNDYKESNTIALANDSGLVNEINTKYYINDEKKITIPVDNAVDSSIINQLTSIASDYNNAIKGGELAAAWTAKVAGGEDKATIMKNSFSPLAKEGEIATLFNDSIKITAEGLENIAIKSVFVENENTLKIIFSCDYKKSEDNANSYDGLVPEFVIKATLDLSKISSEDICCTLSINDLSTAEGEELDDFSLMISRLSTSSFSIADTTTQCDTTIKTNLKDMLDKLNMTLVAKNGENEAKIYISSIFEAAHKNIVGVNAFTAIDVADTISALHSNIVSTAQTDIVVSEQPESPTLSGATLSGSITARNLGAIILNKGYGTLTETFGANSISLNQVAILDLEALSDITDVYTASHLETLKLSIPNLFNGKVSGTYALITLDLDTAKTPFSSSLLPRTINVTAMINLDDASTKIIYNNLTSDEMTVLAALSNNNDAFNSSKSTAELSTYIQGLVVLSYTGYNLTLGQIIASNLGVVASTSYNDSICGRYNITATIPLT